MSEPRTVTIELDPSWADEIIDCYRCSYPITDWSDVVAVPTSVIADDVPTGAAFVHRECPSLAGHPPGWGADRKCPETCG